MGLNIMGSRKLNADEEQLRLKYLGTSKFKVIEQLEETIEELAVTMADKNYLATEINELEKKIIDYQIGTEGSDSEAKDHGVCKLHLRKALDLITYLHVYGSP